MKRKYDDNDEYFIVSSEILPEAILKTAEVNAILNRGEAKSIQEAVAIVGLSRSAYYKYKDKITPYVKESKATNYTVGFELMHRAGVLSEVTSVIGNYGGNILTINQSLPRQGFAEVNLTIDIMNMAVSLSELLGELVEIDGVNKAVIIGERD